MRTFELASVDVMTEIYDYVLKNLPNYNLMFAVKKSDYKEDYYLYMVVCKSKSDGTYTVWTCYNTLTKSMNYGHYSIARLDGVYSVLDEYYFSKENTHGIL